MSKISWVKWKNHQGVKCNGTVKYNPPQPYSLWDRVMGVVARCEGNHDCTISYDNTWTWGFGQWTFNSGRLQKLLESFKSIPSYNFEREGEGDFTLFDDVCCIYRNHSTHPVQIFEPFGFMIRGGKFIDLTMGRDARRVLDPSNKKERKRIVDITSGRIQYKTFKDQKNHAIGLAKLFANMGKQFGVPEAQIHFAKAEFKRALQFKRPPLGNIKTIGNLLEGTWNTPAPALFFNLWQNNPGAAYRLFKKSRNAIVSATNLNYGQQFFDDAWKRACKSKFGNWGFGKPANKSPRVVRIKKAIKEFYGLDLKYIK